ncbi:IBR domain-containing protein [Colletotrichum higginsianum IMI 349063]|uniref:IBR domain-containing protein n=1 Tax=Colletotrichum higginsianum (strain IMI 349063) TaxID=759273 RepID=A0A1B7YDG8_COLHI|nr:IBR domain-containing protein [Colletotrichum higginsianum IMI 349063]OBR10077.1 IBR domain-containing protein [Colletotrichum higginsianum IMI 349063]
MEHFQRLDENIANIVIGHGFLNLDALQFATDEEVENAATLALQMAGPDVQLAIAIQQSGIPGGRRPPPNLDEIPGDPIPRQCITWEERNRLLADSRPNSAATSESDEANENNEQNCIVCSGGRQPKSRLPCGCWMCPPCLRACIRVGLRAGGWPPRCCEPLHQDQIESADRERPGLLSLYRQIREENETEGDDRVPVRERGEIYRQGQDPDEFPAVARLEHLGQPIPQVQPVPMPIPPPQPQLQPQAELFHPQAADGLWQPLPLARDEALETQSQSLPPQTSRGRARVAYLRDSTRRPPLQPPPPHVVGGRGHEQPGGAPAVWLLQVAGRSHLLPVSDVRDGDMQQTQ